ncbi:universal stress protein [bacterium]|nr:universal stress protein [bacterium]
MKVLFCTDGSKISFDALADFLHWVNDVTVDIISVADWSFLPDAVTVEGTDFAVKCANSADSILDYAENFLIENNISVGEKIKMCGVPVDSILEKEVCGEYDFIVLGSNGKRGFKKWLGSVSQEIASASASSIFISKGLANYDRVLFTLDASELSEKVVLECLNKLNFSGKSITLLTVYEIPEYIFLEGSVDSNWVIDVERKQKQESLALLDKYEKMFNDYGLKIYTKAALKGNPHQMIVKYAHNNDIDLVITGIRNKKYYSRFFISSVSKRVLENVNSDVLIIRP